MKLQQQNLTSPGDGGAPSAPSPCVSPGAGRFAEVSMDKGGWVKIYRKIWQNPRVKMAGWLQVWLWMLCKATHNGTDVMWRGSRLSLKPGQFTAGRNQIADETGVAPSQCRNVIATLKTDQQIGQQTSNLCSLYTILNWCLYQDLGQPKGQPLDSKRTAIGQPLDTKQEGEEGKEGEECKKGAIMCAQSNASSIVNQARIIIHFLNENASRSFGESESHLKFIMARLHEVNGDLEGVKRMIMRQCSKWKNDPMMGQYLRPSTLFNKTKFHEYYDDRDTPITVERNGRQVVIPHEQTVEEIEAEINRITNAKAFNPENSLFKKI